MIRMPMQVEGTWDQIASLAQSLSHCRLRLTVLDTHADIGPENQPKQSISDRFAEIRSANPNAWIDVPTDLAEKHDHYIYGWPKG
jgi:hypothetical protein